MDTQLRPEETFALIPRIRFNDTIPRDALIEAVAKQASNNTVNLDDPDVCVLLEVFKNVCGVGLARDYYKLKKYNIYELVDHDLASAKKSQVAKE